MTIETSIDEHGWAHDKNWRGLGLAEPIKNVEVRVIH